MEYSEDISYIFLIAVCIFCLSRTSFHNHPLDLIAYVATGSTAVCALSHEFVHIDLMGDVKEYAEIAESFTYPLLVGYLWTQYCENCYIAYGIPASMLGLKVVGHDILGYDSSQLLVAGYALAEIICIWVSIVMKNIYALTATIVFILTESAMIFKEYLPIPPTEAANYGLGTVMLLFSFAFETAS